jgi:hypothetical protein
MNPHDREMSREYSLFWAPLITISIAVILVEVPFLWLGLPSGHDFEFHLYSWLDVLGQWKHGIVYPRWAALSDFGYGEPRFVFYPPASWTLGATLAAILPWKLVPSVYIWVVLVAAGTSMFTLARRWLDRRDATFAAVLYAVNPYHLVIVYWRSAFAELLASCLLPLLLLMVLRLAEEKRGAVIGLAMVLAAAWLVNAPAAVMIHYSLALLLLVTAWLRRSPHILLEGAATVALGAALAAFYLLPAIYEQKWVNIGEAISVGLRPQDNFLFAHTSDRDHDVFNHLVSWVALAEIVLTFAAAWTARRWREHNREAWYCLVAWAGACCLLMVPVTGLLWSFLPKLRFMQLPWRWMLCLSLTFTLFIVLGIRRWTLRLAIYLAAVLVIAFAWHRIQPPWWDTAADLREMQDNMATGAGYEGTDEYSPQKSDPSESDKDARRVTVDGPAHAAIHVFSWEAESRLFTAEMSAPDNLVLRLLNYPAWRVEVNGQAVEPGARAGAGQMLVPVETGANRVKITFVRTWDRKLGGWISVVAAFLMGTSMLWRRSRNPRRRV